MEIEGIKYRKEVQFGGGIVKRLGVLWRCHILQQGKILYVSMYVHITDTRT